MNISALHTLYREHRLTPEAMLESLYEKIYQARLAPVWVSLVPREEALAFVRSLDPAMISKLPLFGVPFAVKDNIDVAGLPTTAGCPEFAYSPQASASVVQRLRAAGAVLVGKTNLDQFATGLVGTRTPYGSCSSVFSSEHISGGSSSGSAVAVAQGLVSFALGTDTAGSGRVPAAFNGIIGLKPTFGMLSTGGVVPACKTLDCVSIFAETCADAATVFEVARGFDAKEPYSREVSPSRQSFIQNEGFRFGVPQDDQLEFFGDEGSATAYRAAIAALELQGGRKVDINFAPFREAAALLYSGPWTAERLAAVTSLAPGLLEKYPDAIDPSVRSILLDAARFSAVDAFRSAYRLEALRRETSMVWDEIDVLFLPTAPCTFTHAEIAREPLLFNTRLGYYTNFVNLLNLAAIAVPAGVKPDGLPFGASLIAPAGTDLALLRLGDTLHRALNTYIAAGDRLLADTPQMATPGIDEQYFDLVVVGAHLTGQPLNWQLTERKATLLTASRTAPEYRLYALANTKPPKPGLVYEPGFAGPGIEVEVWRMPVEMVGSFLTLIPPPLSIGNVHLEDSRVVKGFLCEGFAVARATEITELGGWRAYRALSA